MGVPLTLFSDVQYTTVLGGTRTNPPCDLQEWRVAQVSFYRKRRPKRSPLGCAIRSIRKRLDLNQGELAQAVGWHRVSVVQCETGIGRPGADRLIRLLRLAATDAERVPILEQLRARGVAPEDLSPILASSRCAAATSGAGSSCREDSVPNEESPASEEANR